PPSYLSTFHNPHETFQRFDLRFFRPFRADLSIRKSSSFLPPLIASTSHLGFAPRPAQSLTRTAPIFRRDFPSFQCTSPASNYPCATQGGQLLLKLGTTPVKHFVNPLSQVHQCFDAHP